jgi:adenine deaminase
VAETVPVFHAHPVIGPLGEVMDLPGLVEGLEAVN